MGYAYDATVYAVIPMTVFASSKDEIAESEFGSNRFLVFKVPHVAQPLEDEVYGG